MCVLPCGDGLKSPHSQKWIQMSCVSGWCFAALMQEWMTLGAAWTLTVQCAGSRHCRTCGAASIPPRPSGGCLLHIWAEASHTPGSLTGRPRGWQPCLQRGAEMALDRQRATVEGRGRWNGFVQGCCWAQALLTFLSGNLGVLGCSLHSMKLRKTSLDLSLTNTILLNLPEWFWGIILQHRENIAKY